MSSSKIEPKTGKYSYNGDKNQEYNLSSDSSSTTYEDVSDKYSYEVTPIEFNLIGGSISSDIHIFDSQEGTGTPSPTQDVTTPEPETTTQPKKEETTKPETTTQPKKEETTKPETTTQPKKEETTKPETTTEPKKEETTKPETTKPESQNQHTTPAKTSGTYIPGRSAADGYGPAYLEKVKQIADKYGLDYKELLALFYSESGVDAHSYNGTYAGVMQMNADACAAVGTTPYQLAHMSPIEQLDYIDKNIAQKKKWPGFNDVEDLYAANFLPGRVNNAYLTKKGDHDYKDKNGNWRSYYDDNKGLDINGDGVIDKTDLSLRLDKKMVDESSFKA